MKFVHLHAHTTFSFLDGYGNPEQVAKRVKELGQESCAITDHGNVIGHVPCYKEYLKHGINPILGCEFYICDNIANRSREQQSLGYNCLPHITVLAKNNTGYKNLLKLSKISWVEGFYYKPRIDHQTLIENSEGLIVLSGCAGGYPTRLFEVHGRDRVIEHIQYLKNSISDYYIEVTPQPGLPVSEKYFDELINIAIRLGIPPVVTADAHFPDPNQYKYQDAMLAVGMRTTIFDKNREIKLPEYQYYCSAEEILERCKQVSSLDSDTLAIVINNSYLISQGCKVELPKAESVSFPNIPIDRDSSQYLWDLIWLKLNEKIENGKIPKDKSQEYIDRVSYEFLIIKEKGFCDYILAIWDVITWMKQQDYLVNLRGSAGGCLMLWVLECSVTNPIMHGLSFERFYDNTRPDPPDIDIDFEQNKRSNAIQYVYNTYGKENCSQIAALSKIKPKSAIIDAAKALGIHRGQITALSEVIDEKDLQIPQESSDSRANSIIQKYPKLIDIANGMIGQYRQSSIHAAGVLISQNPLDNIVGIMLGSDKQQVSAIDKYGAKDLGFLKMDFLSVSSLDVVAETARKVKGNAGWILDIIPNDPKVFETADKGMLAGIFQLDGASAVKICQQIGIHSFEDIIAASVLCRPGPANHVNSYKERKYDHHKLAEYLRSINPIAADIVRDTYGVLMYQEQVMRMAREMAGLDWKNVHRLRKEVADKKGLDPENGDKWRAEWYQLFVNGCIQNGIRKEEAEYWWSSIQTHGAYSFNKSHAVSYAYVGYWMLYLKTYYPAMFYESYLNIEKEDTVKKKLINEFINLNGVVILLDHEHSEFGFKAISEMELVGGYSDIKNIGPAGAKKMNALSPFNSNMEMLDNMPKRARDSIVRSNYFDFDLPINQQELILCAQWHPVTTIDPQFLSLRSKYNLRTISQLPNVSMNGDVYLCGYVTVKDFSKNKIIFILEDETGYITCRIANKHLKTKIGELFRDIKVSDFIAVRGWWTGDTIFASEYQLLGRSEFAQ